MNKNRNLSSKRVEFRCRISRAEMDGKYNNKRFGKICWRNLVALAHLMRCILEA